MAYLKGECWNACSLVCPFFWWVLALCSRAVPSYPKAMCDVFSGSLKLRLNLRGMRSNQIEILFRMKVQCFKPKRLKQKYRNTLQLAAGKDILAFCEEATPSRSIKSFYDFITNPAGARYLRINRRADSRRRHVKKELAALRRAGIQHPRRHRSPGCTVARPHERHSGANQRVVC